jgi:putative SOS response-associated peptidase YedK
MRRPIATCVPVKCTNVERVNRRLASQGFAARPSVATLKLCRGDACSIKLSLLQQASLRLPEQYPANTDYPAPVVRNVGDAEAMALMRWGMPPPPRTGGPPVTNIRNTTSPHWRMWLKPENRCLVPANSFAEYGPATNPATKKKDVVWFALNDDRPLFAFAGIWTAFNGDRGTKSKPIPGPHSV